MVATKTDLGAIPSLYGKPTDYAKFLGQEISGLYVGPLLITMPTGYGIYDGGRSTAAEQRVLAGLAPAGSTKADDVTTAATTAARDLLRAGALKSKDILAPMVSAVSARLAGDVLTAVFYISDDSGRAAAKLAVVHARRTVATIPLPMHATHIQFPVQVRDRVRASVPRTKSQLCVTAVDPSGNRSPKSCVALRR